MGIEGILGMFGGGANGGNPMEAIMKMIGGADGMQGLVKKFVTPENVAMVGDKTGDLFAFLAEKLTCQKSDIGIYVKWENILVKDAAGIITLTPDGQQVRKEKPIIYIMVGNTAKESYTLEQFASLMMQSMDSAKKEEVKQ
jgi:hypothetical protein